MRTTDFLVVGSGVAGLTFALKAAEIGKVLIVTKASVTDANTNFAQGGIAAVTDITDSFEKHIHDTMV
nr:FAD-binding protein [Bacteroidales bacterium]